MLLLTFFMCPTHDQGLVRLPLAYSRSRFPPAPAPACRYGGGNVGLMGAIAETVGRGLGEEHVIGVIPAALAPREISGTTVGEIRLVEAQEEVRGGDSAQAVRADGLDLRVERGRRLVGRDQGGGRVFARVAPRLRGLHGLGELRCWAQIAGSGRIGK